MVMVNLRTWSGDRRICETCGDHVDVMYPMACDCRPMFVQERHMIRVYVGWEIVVHYAPAMWRGGEAVIYERSFRS